MNRRRLEHLIQVLDRVPDDRFDLNAWTHTSIFKSPNEMPDDFIKTDCQTVCCAIGWAAMDKGFNAEGFGLVKDKRGWALTPAYKNLKNWEAVEAFFGLDEYTALDLFSSASYSYPHPKPVDVIIKIRKLFVG